MQATSPHNRTRLQIALPGALAVLAAAAMMMAGLNDFSMWFDEIRMLLPTLGWQPLNLATWVFRPGHPPLYFLLLRGWIALAGQSDFSLRLLSWMFCVLAAAVIVRIGKDLSHSLFAGIAAATLFGAMGFVRYFVHETHNYALLMLMSTVLLFFYERWWANPKRRAYMVGSVLATAGVMYTHYYAVYFVLALNLFALISGWRRMRDLWRWVSFQVMAGVLYIPWLGVVVFLVNKVASRLGTKRTQGINVSGTKWVIIVETVNTLLSDQLVLYGILAVIGVVGLVLLARTRKGEGRKTLDPVILLLLLTVGTLTMALVGNLIFKTFSARRVIYVLPALALLIGYALFSLPRIVREAVAVAAVGLIFVSGYSSYLPGNWGFRQMIETVDADFKPGDLLFLQMPAASLPGLPLTYYADTILPRHTSVLTLDEGGLQTPDSRQYFASTTFGPRVAARDAFWVISSTDPVYGEPTLDWVPLLGRKFERTKTEHIGIFDINLYTAEAQTRRDMPDGTDLSSVLALPVTLGDMQFELDRAQVSAELVRPGDTVTVWLDWRALTPPGEDYAVFVHVLKGETLIAQQDGDPEHLGQPLPTSLWPDTLPIYDAHQVVIPKGTPPGAYALIIGLYSRASGARLQVTPQGVTIDGLMLEAIQVLPQ